MNISVVIPTFNRASTIADAVRSVLDQSLAPAEVIVVDDGSTDATRDALTPFMGDIRYVLSSNGGVSRARNLGILAARSEWIAFLDSDDIWHREKLVHQSLCLSATGMRVCFSASIDDAGRLLEPRPGSAGLQLYPARDPSAFRSEAHPFIQSMLAHREVFGSCGFFDESLSVAEDTLMFSRIASRCGFAFLAEPMVTIRRTREFAGLSDSVDPESAYRRYDCYRRVQERILDETEENDIAAAATARRRAAYFASRQAEIACALGQRTQARVLTGHSRSLGASGRDRIRNGLIRHAWPLARRHYGRKWACQSGSTTRDDVMHANAHRG
jgi:glycosyltransferase involved in cell wall biosynthesis